MTTNPEARQPDRVDRAADAMRRMPVPQTPADVVNKIVSAGIETPDPVASSPRRRRIFTMNRMIKIAASVVMAAGVSAVLWMAVGPGGTTVAWADVQEQLSGVRTLSFRMTMDSPDAKPMTMKMMMNESGLIRLELLDPQQATAVFDLRNAKAISVASDGAKAVLYDLSGIPDQSRQSIETLNMLERLKALAQTDDVERLDDREIAGITAQGYRAGEAGQEVTLWVDPLTRLPIEIETVLGDSTIATLTDFEFDRELDASLFSLEIPERCDPVAVAMDLANPSADSIAELLSVWSLKVDQAFLTTLAWADVQERLSTVRALGFTGEIPLPDGTVVTVKLRISETGVMRQEMVIPQKEGMDGPQEIVNIIDMAKGRTLALIPAEKKAVIVDISGLPASAKASYERMNMLTGLRLMANSSNKNTERLADRQIGGLTVQGYRVDTSGQMITLWIDPATGLPVEMETAIGDKIVATFGDFEFNDALDPELFTQTIPEGYEVVKMAMDLTNRSADDVVVLLRFWIDNVNGRFPASLDLGAMVEGMQGIEGKLSDAEEMAFGEIMTRAIMLILEHPGSQYVGKDVTVGDADAAVFWYRPKNSETFKVIYGDLSIRDVAEADLPEVPETTEAEPATQPVSPAASE